VKDLFLHFYIIWAKINRKVAIMCLDSEVVMARCKNCGSEIDANANLCPICGQINPIKTKKVKTTDMTMKFQQENLNVEGYRQKSRKITATLFFLVGFSGAPYFYLKDLYRAALSLFGTALILGSAYLLGLFVFSDVVLPLIIAIALIYFVNIGLGLYYLSHHELKDGQGEFLV